MNMKADTQNLEITDHISFSNFLENKFLNSRILQFEKKSGAIGQIDLVGSTAFTVSKTTVRETLEKESEIFESNLTGNKLDFEDEMLLTRNDLIKRDIIYGVKTIAYNGNLIGKLRIVATWLGLETLGTEGDKIIVYGEKEKDVLAFCLVVTQIFNKKAKKGLQGFGYRCGIAAVRPENQLIIYKNDLGQFLTAKGDPISNAENMEANAHGNAINVEKELIEVLNEFNFRRTRDGFYCLDQNQVFTKDFRNQLNELIKQFEEKDKEIPFSVDSNYSITKKTPIAFLKVDVAGKPEIFFKKFINDLRQNNILLLRVGVIKDGKTVLICQPEISRKPSYSLLSGFKNLLKLGYKFKLGLTRDYLWIGNITFFNDERSSYDVMGQSINLAARIVYKTDVEAPAILASNNFLDALEEEGYAFVRNNLKPIEFLAKGFDKPMNAFILNEITIEESELSRLFKKNKNFAQIIVEVSSRISNILFDLSKNYYFAINASNFLTSKIILISGMNQDTAAEEVLEMQRQDFYTLANVALANLSRGRGIIDSFESIITKVPDLKFPRFLLKNLNSEIVHDLTKLSLITFGRVFDFKVATLKQALGFDDEKIKKYESLGLLWVNRKRVFAKLQPPLAYILDLRATDTDRLSLHKTICLYLWKGIKKEQKGSRTWYEKGRVLALHARFTNANDLPLKLKAVLVEIFEYAIKERELLDLLIFESNLLDKISTSAKKELFYELALVNLKFQDTIKAYEILNSIKKLRKTIILSQKVDFFYDLCIYKLQVSLDQSSEQKRLMTNEKIWKLMNEEEILIAENILEV